MRRISNIFFAFIITALFVFLPANVWGKEGDDDQRPCVPIYGQGCPTPTPKPTPTPTPTPTPVPTPITIFLPQGGNINNTNTNNNAQTQTVSVAQSPQVTLAGAPARQVAGVSAKELPKTGVPQLAWLALASIPAGFGMRRFGAQGKDGKEGADYIWQMRQFLKGGER